MHSLGLYGDFLKIRFHHEELEVYEVRGKVRWEACCDLGPIMRFHAQKTACGALLASQQWHTADPAIQIEPPQ
ncbi:hypothetical protein A6X21_22790 [Planctopirus hydrillae]|uniref:Uncharacterized protein n=1 Tax=Planctopirus hydrillae TaxID=1841610 RepID=A0A1C3EDB9_9PLAN|nr:hypothetical protein A6X21_22790 [Planctopirus hydrillae]